jgi:predicted RNase H-like HicB family nuclease
MAIDWSKIYKKYKGLWVALKNDEKTVVASGKTAKEALNTAREKASKTLSYTECRQKFYLM